MTYLQPQLVEIFQGRWDVTFIVTDKDGEVHTYIASADSAFTEGSGIWFGTREEYDEASKDLF